MKRKPALAFGRLRALEHMNEAPLARVKGGYQGKDGLIKPATILWLVNEGLAALSCYADGSFDGVEILPKGRAVLAELEGGKP